MSANESEIVYLAGPIGAKTPDEATGWRDHASERLTSAGFLVTSPMRGKEMLARDSKIGVDYGSKYGDVPELNPQSIYARDIYDVTRAGIILANMSEIEMVETGRHIEQVKTDIWVKNCRSEDGCEFCWEKREIVDRVPVPSLGTDWEMGYAAALRKMIVMIAPADSYYMQHPFPRIGTNIQFTSLDDGIDWIIRNYGIYNKEQTR